MGLIVNEAKSELICDDSEAVKQFQEVAPNVVNVRCENAMLRAEGRERKARGVLWSPKKSLK